jgi:DNA-binding winged helix-turn-helix (wHTH) protein
MRDIGHKILLSSGDSVSRVLPISKINGNQYQIRFANALNFTTDSIIKIIQQAVATNHLPNNYIVNVVDNNTNESVYGFVISKTAQNNLLPCKGRKQPKAHYTLNIRFSDASTNLPSKNYFVGASGGMAALMLTFLGIKKHHQKNKSSIPSLDDAISAMGSAVMIGQYKFLRDQQCLTINDEQIKLSDKETKVLDLLAYQINMVVERNELQKIWEDDGVIVGRSLDMFVSKLRKKLNKDSAVRLVNVHGKGYKLEVALHGQLHV